ncbi:MAG TPA: NAD+ synthase [Bacteroidetes bacterium]|nr:NAD+ synthase [Bacteroidota bacterium]
MKIALAQLNYHTGHFKKNTRRILEHIEKARSQKADLIVFAELALTGYPPRDFLEFSEFLDECELAVQQVAAACIDMVCILGAPARNPQKKGKALHNAAFVLADGKVQQVVHKALLPTYDIFDEYRYFEPAKSFSCIHIKGQPVALTICEDLWNVSESGIYPETPMEHLIKEKPVLMINIAASPFSRNHIETRKAVLEDNCRQYGLPLLYLNHVGAQTEIIFDGGSLAMNADGSLVDEMAYFNEEFKVYDFKDGCLEQVGHDSSFLPKDRIELIHDALITGIRDYFNKLGFKKALLGSSGGIDSAVVQVLAAKALGPENVLAVLLPSRYSSDHSVQDAQKLSKNLGNPTELVSIEPAVSAFEGSLKDLFDGKAADLTEENMQARSRAVILMAISNKFGSILLNTSNKSENAVGYGTLYGDMCGGLSVIGDVYKTQVYELAAFINREKEIIPENIIRKAPSAELRPDQKDSDSLPDYDVLDAILYQYIENRKGPKELLAEGFDEALVRRIIRLVNLNEYKRHQTPPILRVSSKAFGMGRRMPIVAKYLL